MTKTQEQLFKQWLSAEIPLTLEQQAQLASLGLDVFRPIQAIDPQRIQSAIDFSEIDVVFSTHSTQQQVKPNSTLIAEHQSAGVGQRGKSWLTPLGSSICLSHRFKLALPLSQLAGYTLTVALACLQSIKHFDPQAAVSIKWPNDLYCHGIKFAGILTQAQALATGHTEITLGIGINWQLGPQHFAQIDQPVCNIPLNTQNVNRTDFIIALLHQIHEHKQKFCQHGCAGFLELWQQHDQLNQQEVTVNTAQGSYTGNYAGISPLGELQINCNGELKRFASGEAQLNKN